MAVYFLKRYYKLIPTHGAVWSLGKDTAFEAKNNDEAIVIGKFQQAADVKPLSELVLVLDPDGKQIWESFQTDEVSSEQEEDRLPDNESVSWPVLQWSLR